MANYYFTTINSKKITPIVAANILLDFSETNRVRGFEFSESGKIYLNSRGLPDTIDNILNKYGLTKDEVEIKDEFSYEEIL